MQAAQTRNVVFNCLKCNLIIGDSTSIKECNDNLQVIILNRALNIQKSANIIKLELTSEVLILISIVKVAKCVVSVYL